MRYLSLTMVALTFLLISPTCLAETDIGHVVIAEGDVFSQKGSVHFSRPGIGDQVKVNAFGQYRDIKPTAAYVEWQPQLRKKLSAGDILHEGDVLQTSSAGRLKILLKDSSIIEVGPNTVFNLVRVDKTFLKLMIGRIHVVVNKKLTSPTDYQIATADTLLGVRGTEFFVVTESLKKSQTTTEILCTHGQVSVDVAKNDKNGILYHQPYVVNPNNRFQNLATRGISEQSNLEALSARDARARVAEISPGIGARASGSVTKIFSQTLPGTGTVQKIYTANASRGREISSFDMEKEPRSRGELLPSGNFKIPNDFEIGKISRHKSSLYLPVMGQPPVSFLPGNVSRVQLNIGN